MTNRIFSIFKENRLLQFIVIYGIFYIIGFFWLEGRNVELIKHGIFEVGQCDSYLRVFCNILFFMVCLYVIYIYLFSVLL